MLQVTFGDAASDACDNDPNCHGSTDANGVLVNYTCDTLSSDPANSASPCYNASMATFNAEKVPAFPLPTAAPGISSNMLLGIGVVGAIAGISIIGLLLTKPAPAKAALGRRRRRYPRFY